jgi:hypothetical protein
MTTASPEDVAELLGERADEAIVDRIASLGASIEEIIEAIDDVAYERRFGEATEPASPKIDEIRAILEELPPDEAVTTDLDEDEDDEGLTIVGPEALAHEPQ